MAEFLYNCELVIETDRPTAIELSDDKWDETEETAIQEHLGELFANFLTEVKKYTDSYSCAAKAEGKDINFTLEDDAMNR